MIIFGILGTPKFREPRESRKTMDFDLQTTQTNVIAFFLSRVGGLANDPMRRKPGP